MRITEFGGDAISNTVINEMLGVSNVLQIAEFYPIIGNADSTRKAASASGGSFRALNTDYSTNQATPAFATPTLKIFGDKVQVDRAHERRGSDVASVRALELLSFARYMGKEFQSKFINSTTSATAFSGLKEQITGGQLITAATNGFSVVLGNDNAAKLAQQKFLEMIDSLIASVDGGATALSMDANTISRLTRIAEGQVIWSKDEFGVPLAFYNGIPLLPTGFDKSGSKVVGHAEAVGTSGNVCTSIYAYKFGEKSDLSIATNVGVEVKDLGLVGVHYTHSVDLDLDLVMINPKSAARLQGLILA